MIEEWKEITTKAAFGEGEQKNDKAEEVKPKKKNSLETVFGIWKDENISIDSIRQKAWQRKK